MRAPSRLVNISVYGQHATLGILLTDRTVTQLVVAGVPEPNLARRHLAGLRRVLSVHIDLTGSEPACRLRASTRWLTDRDIPLAVAFALAMGGTPTSVKMSGSLASRA